MNNPWATPTTKNKEPGLAQTVADNFNAMSPAGTPPVSPTTPKPGETLQDLLDQRKDNNSAMDPGDSEELVEQSNTEAPAHVVVISFQEKNWEDDGGDHDPILRHLTPTQFAWLKIITSNHTVLSEEDPMFDAIANAPVPALPATVELVETVWISF